MISSTHMRGRGSWSSENWRRRIIVSAILCMAPLVLVACAVQDPLAATSETLRIPSGSTPAGAVLSVSTPAEYSYFGGSVAIDGNTAVIGAWGEADRGRNTGAAYVFDRVGDEWTQSARLTASDAAAGARFGHAVAIDGDRVLVGAVYHGANGPRAGAVYAFERFEDAWLESDLLVPSDPAADAYFGSALAMDGTSAVIGASGPNAEAAYIFVSSERGWRQEARLAPTPPMANARFGSRVAIHNDAVVVAAPTPSYVFVFERVADAWRQTAQLTAGDGANDRQFGESVSIHGNRVAVGAPGDVDAVFVFERTGSSWILEDEILGHAERAEFFGASVALSEDALAVGAPGSHDRTGAVYLYQRATDGWTATGQVVASEPTEDLQLGGAVAVDGTVALIGATGGRSAGIASGAAFAVH